MASLKGFFYGMYQAMPEDDRVRVIRAGARFAAQHSEPAFTEEQWEKKMNIFATESGLKTTMKQLDDLRAAKERRKQKQKLR